MRRNERGHLFLRIFTFEYNCQRACPRITLRNSFSIKMRFRCVYTARHEEIVQLISGVPAGKRDSGTVFSLNTKEASLVLSFFLARFLKETVKVWPWTCRPDVTLDFRPARGELVIKESTTDSSARCRNKILSTKAHCSKNERGPSGAPFSAVKRSRTRSAQRAWLRPDF